MASRIVTPREDQCSEHKATGQTVEVLPHVEPEKERSLAGQQLGDTPHGIGNRRVLEAYRRWMRAHRSEIAGFDANQPTLSQLDKLTDAQIVAVARSIDPLARTAR